jgi:type IV fimbrial biogenesis protein FimT
VHTITAKRLLVRGFTLVEILVAMAILSIMLAIGVPNMRTWMASSTALSAAEFYAEGLKMARAEAVKRNAVTRLTLVEGAANTQMGWNIDLCVPTPDALCTAESGSWSTTVTAADGANATDFLSVNRAAVNLPATTMLTVTRFPAGAVAVYFTPVGWVDGNITPSLNKLVLAPAAGQDGAFPTSAVTLTLAGVVTKCNPAAAVHDSRGCPP